MSEKAASTRWLPVAALAAVLAAILALLYERTQGYDAAGHLEDVAVLRQIKQLDAQWELDVLKARMGLRADYDPLVDPLRQLNDLQQALQAGTAGEAHLEAAALARTGELIGQAVQGKTRLVERFKSHNALLRNSLSFLPTAADELREALEGQGAASPRGGSDIAARVNDVLLDTLVFSHDVSLDRVPTIEAKLALLSADRPDVPPETAERIELFLAHVRTVLREQPIVERLLADIGAVPTAALTDELENVLAREQRDGAERSELNRLYLLAFAAALAGLIVYAAASLIRSHAVIKRVNQALRGANAKLEQRVAERTRELDAAQREATAAARQAGMAEIANDVLHNVGNVLNSVNVSVGIVSGRLREFPAAKLAQVAAMLKQHAGDLGAFFAHDERGRLLPEYLDRLAGAYEAERQGVVKELDALVRSVDHIKDIVAAQQAHAGTASLVEAASVSDLVDDALRMSSASLTRHHVAVVKDLAEVPALLLDRQRLVQILVNLINNAKQAMGEVLDHPRQITLRTRLAEHADGRRLVLQVADVGEGISAENMKRIFSHGFTTRRNGHGFGLHSCILAAKEMGGTLRAHSNGPGHGATFTLELPVALPGVHP
ncbi:DAHL domain-containing protein [Caldimonas sp. KR1-144]|uniref:DAHL domain-containing protein n=1 Tax=Caldimonas sp. KR1-144 TaxID=3400911 RepID=UPI003BFF4A3D